MSVGAVVRCYVDRRAARVLDLRPKNGQWWFLVEFTDGSGCRLVPAPVKGKATNRKRRQR